MTDHSASLIFVLEVNRQCLFRFLHHLLSLPYAVNDVSQYSFVRFLIKKVPGETDNLEAYLYRAVAGTEAT